VRAAGKPCGEKLALTRQHLSHVLLPSVALLSGYYSCLFGDGQEGRVTDKVPQSGGVASQTAVMLRTGPQASRPFGFPSSPNCKRLAAAERVNRYVIE